ncbi:SRPBCC family protein [Mycolicibacterium goodii]|uniref:SRPBCC family protein n=1 Tax=Mycolicibacterium goodii TaxID=134601 RepID=UPI0012FF9A77
MGQASRSRVIPAQQQAIWDVLADFGALSSWVDKIDHSSVLNAHPEVLGTTRRVQVGRTVLVERITEFEPPTVLAYAIEGLPARMGSLTNRWTLRPTGAGTEVTVTSIVRTVGVVSALTSGVTARVLAKQSDAMLAGLARQMGAAT